jgi:nitroimidazol reductase NimA-like FMN-containing flavoprotein (pyridoxamine 5'-phosphate oxidase superfamily)
VAHDPSVEIDRNGLEVLDRDVCLQLLAEATIGRVGVSHGALPVVLPVNFVLTDAGVVFRTRRGTKLDAAVDGAVVAFEADAFDPLFHSGWSVVVTGVAAVRELDDLPERAQLAPRWAAPGHLDDERYVLIPTEIVSGRRVGRDVSLPIASPVRH